MGGGESGLTGQIAARLVLKEYNLDTGIVTIHLHNMEENNALEILTRVNIVASNLVLCMENGQSGQTGQTAVKHVMLDSRKGQDCASIQILNLLHRQVTFFPVLEMRLTCGSASKDLVLIKANGLNGQAGLNVLSAVDLESRKGSRTAVEMET